MTVGTAWPNNLASSSATSVPVIAVPEVVVDDQHVEPAAQRLRLRERLLAIGGFAGFEAGGTQQHGGRAAHGFVIVDVQDESVRRTVQGG